MTKSDHIEMILALFKSAGVNPLDRAVCIAELSDTVMPSRNTSAYLEWIETKAASLELNGVVVL